MTIHSSKEIKSLRFLLTRKSHTPSALATNGRARSDSDPTGSVASPNSRSYHYDTLTYETRTEADICLPSQELSNGALSTSSTSTLRSQASKHSRLSPWKTTDKTPESLTPLDHWDSLTSLSDRTVSSLYKPASPKRNTEFHGIFRSVPDADVLFETYSCALQKDILLQGHMYISEHHVCFKANIFGWVTSLVIAYSDIESVEKRMTAKIIPNGIQISTSATKFAFASFLNRDQAYEHIVCVWKSHLGRRSPRVTAHPIPTTDPSDSSEQEPGSESPDDVSDNEMKHGNAVQFGTDPQHISVGGTTMEDEATSRHCPCEKDDHYRHIVFDGRFHHSVEWLDQLLHDNAIVTRFLVENEYAHDVIIESWHGGERKGSYVQQKHHATPIRFQFHQVHVYRHPPRCLVVESSVQRFTSMNTSATVKLRICITRVDKAVSHILATLHIHAQGHASPLPEIPIVEAQRRLFHRLYHVLHHPDRLRSLLGKIPATPTQSKQVSSIHPRHRSWLGGMRATLPHLAPVTLSSPPRWLVLATLALLVLNAITAIQLQSLSRRIHATPHTPFGTSDHLSLHRMPWVDLLWIQSNMDEMHTRVKELREETHDQRQRLRAMYSQ